jgi:excisionase family DNA binding protein
MGDHLSTEQVGWILEKSAGSIREMIQSGEIEAVRLPAGYRVPRAEVLRLARDRIERESDRRVTDRQLERLIDQVIATNTARTQGT